MSFGRRGLVYRSYDPRAGGGFGRSKLPAPAGGNDPNFANVALLLDFAGADEGQVTSDLSTYDHPVTFNGTASIETSVQWLGTNTVELPGGPGNSVTINNDADEAVFQFGTDDFTVEGMWEFDNAAGAVVWTLISFRDASDPGGGVSYWAIQYVNSGGEFLRFLYVKESVTIFNFFHEITLSSATQYHIAISRQSGTMRMFLDGVELTSAVHADNIDVEPGSSTGLFVGDLPVQGNEFDGFAAGIRITEGLARYTASFPALTEFYPTS